ncbi:MAG: YdcF family protein [Chitinophagaceae bacterium]
MLQKIKQFFARKWSRRVLLLLLCWATAHITYITYDGLHDYTGSADVAIILGNQVHADGSLSPWLQGRVDKAVDLYRQGKVKKIFASGGRGTKKDGFYPEGDAMKAYLVKQGILAADIIADNDGKNTFLTAKNFMEWNRTNGAASVIVVSQFYHITRSKYILHKLGFKTVYGASSVRYGWNDIVGTLREVPAFYKYLLFY